FLFEGGAHGTQELADDLGRVPDDLAFVLRGRDQCRIGSARGAGGKAQDRRHDEAQAPTLTLHGGVHQFRRKVCIACATAAACSTCGRWPALGIMVSVGPGVSRWNAPAYA